MPATLTVPVIPTPVADITFVFRFGAQVQVNGTRDVVAESFAVAIAELLDFDRDLICCIAFELDGERFRRADTVTFDAVAFSGRSTASPEDKELVVNAVEDVKRKVSGVRWSVCAVTVVSLCTGGVREGDCPPDSGGENHCDRQGFRLDRYLCIYHISP